MPVTTTLMPVPKQQYFAFAGIPLVGGKIWTYAATTNNPKATYTDAAGTIAQANPIILNARGEPDNAIFWSGSYKVVVMDALNNIVYTVDNYNTDPAGVWGLVTTFATAAGSTMVGFIQAGVGAVLRMIREKLRESVSVADFGAVGDGVADDTAAIQAAINTGRAVKLNSGTFKVTAPLSLTTARFFGEGPARSKIYASLCHAFTIAPNAGFSRPACIVEGIGISSPALNCDDKYAFYVPGVAVGAAPVYNSGFTVRDVEIGSDGRMGGGFYLKDLFRANIENVGLTGVSYMIRLVGSVVQSKFRNVTSNNDAAGVLLSNHGIGTETATYNGGTILTPENIRFIDCAAIRCDRGINHTAGLDIEFVNFDTEAKYYGAYINASCIMRGGILAPSGSGTAATWAGLFRGSNAANIGDATVFDGVDINCLSSPTTPAGSYGIDLGDGVSPVNGLTIRNCRVRGVAGSLAMAIRGRNLNDATIEDNFVISNIATGSSVNLTGTSIWFDRNRIQYGNVTIYDNGSASAMGSVRNNQLSSLTFAPTNTANWEVYGNLSTEIPLWHGVRTSGGVLMAKTTTLNSGVDVAQMGAGAAAFYEINASGFPGANAAACALKVGSQTSGRSINAVGTINASGADYAEYERNNGLVIMKGAVVGFKADGTLTMTFAEAVRFGVKSTAPSYVGGDTWGDPEAIGERPVEPIRPMPVLGVQPINGPVERFERHFSTVNGEFEEVVLAEGASDAEWAVQWATYQQELAEYEARLEAARNLVDRVAYAGKVPVNVTGTQPGGYIVAASDAAGNIVGQFVAVPDFPQYRAAVGRVNRVLPDGRAEVAVMVH